MQINVGRSIGTDKFVWQWSVNERRSSHYVQESTFHGVSHLRYSKSKARIAFWLILTLVGIGYTCFEISTEIDRISSGVKFEANYLLARTNEIHLPWIAYCYSNPLDIFDWAIVANYMDVYNWTIEDVGHLLSLDPAFTDFKLMSTTVSKQHFYRFRKINYEFFESMHKEICQEQNRTGGSPLVVTPRLVDMTPCILIDCLPNDEANEDLVYSLIASGNNMGDEVAMNLRLSIIDFMWKVHGLHLDTEAPPILAPLQAPFLGLPKAPIKLLGDDWGP
uniref:Uncharacterized protein n=1 Tax=Romanomermis culicivorax TaxID=13658 RepID=A0A915HMW1_ROMCU